MGYFRCSHHNKRFLGAWVRRFVPRPLGNTCYERVLLPVELRNMIGQFAVRLLLQCLRAIKDFDVDRDLRKKDKREPGIFEVNVVCCVGRVEIQIEI